MFQKIKDILFIIIMMIILLLAFSLGSCSVRKIKIKKDCEDICYPQKVSWQQENLKCVCRPEVR